MRWRKVGGGGEILKWNDVGQELVGVFAGTKAGKFEMPLGMIDQEDGRRVVFATHISLVERLQDVKPGQPIRIVYLGLQMSNQGRQFKAFDLFVAEDNDGQLPLFDESETRI